MKLQGVRHTGGKHSFKPVILIIDTDCDWPWNECNGRFPIGFHTERNACFIVSFKKLVED